MTGWATAVSLAFSGVALVVAAMSWWQSKRSADAGKASAEASVRSAGAAERSAVAAEISAAAETTRLDLEHPAIAFAVTRDDKLHFRICNTGRTAVTGITLSMPEGSDPGQARGLPAGIALEPDEASEQFVLVTASGMPLPPHLRLEYDGMTEQRHLPVVP